MIGSCHGFGNFCMTSTTLLSAARAIVKTLHFWDGELGWRETFASDSLMEPLPARTRLSHPWFPSLTKAIQQAMCGFSLMEAMQIGWLSQRKPGSWHWRPVCQADFVAHAGLCFNRGTSKLCGFPKSVLNKGAPSKQHSRGKDCSPRCSSARSQKVGPA